MNIYTRKGSSEFNAYIDSTLSQMAEEFRTATGEAYIAVVLGGGYGRAEGACVTKNAQEALYNDLDLFLITKEHMPVPEAVEAVAKKYEKILGIDVDVGKPLTLEDIAHLPHQLMWQDLYYGHTVLNGDKEVITAHVPDYLTKPLPAVEALRLLLNRGSGVLQAVQHGYCTKTISGYTLPDPDFIRRNYQKCSLALGDALLISARTYTVKLEERLARLDALLPELSLAHKQSIRELYSNAITFKQEPDTFPPEQYPLETLFEMAELWGAVLLYTEQKRTGKEFLTLTDYSRDSFIREPDQHRGKQLIRNIVKNIKRKKFSGRYPRETLYRQLAELLATPQPGTPGWDAQARAFYHLWLKYN